MKNFLTGLVGLVFAQAAFGSDKFENEIDCKTITQPSEADSGLHIVIQVNPTAWIKRAAIIEDGYLGHREIGNFSIPLNQPKVSGSSFFNSKRIATYKVANFEMKMEVTDQKGEHALGPARAHVELHGYEPVDLNLDCRRVD